MIYTIRLIQSDGLLPPIERDLDRPQALPVVQAAMDWLAIRRLAAEQGRPLYDRWEIDTHVGGEQQRAVVCGRVRPPADE